MPNPANDVEEEDLAGDIDDLYGDEYEDDPEEPEVADDLDEPVVTPDPPAKPMPAMPTLPAPAADPAGVQDPGQIQSSGSAQQTLSDLDVLRKAVDAKLAGRKQPAPVVPPRDLKGEMDAQPWAPADGFKPSPAQRKLAKAFMAQGQYSEWDMGQATKDRQAQEMGMPFAVELHPAQLISLSDMAERNVPRNLASPQRQVAVRQLFEYSVQQQMKAMAMAAEKSMIFRENRIKNDENVSRDRERAEATENRQEARDDRQTENIFVKDSLQVAEAMRKEAERREVAGAKAKTGGLTPTQSHRFLESARTSVSREYSQALKAGQYAKIPAEAPQSTPEEMKIAESKIMEEHLRTPEAREAKAQEMAEADRMPHVANKDKVKEWSDMMKSLSGGKGFEPGQEPEEAKDYAGLNDAKLQKIYNQAGSPNEVGMTRKKGKKIREAIEAAMTR